MTRTANNMLSAGVHNYIKPILDDIEKQKIEQDNQVLLGVCAMGLCHSDIHLINGD
jgi:D-arabinose 1-dehydrogenase-like Zn-dependent alcohol dehydrogenase